METRKCKVSYNAEEKKAGKYITVTLTYDLAKIPQETKDEVFAREWTVIWQNGFARKLAKEDFLKLNNQTIDITVMQSVSTKKVAVREMTEEEILAKCSKHPELAQRIMAQLGIKI